MHRSANRRRDAHLDAHLGPVIACRNMCFVHSAPHEATTRAGLANVERRGSWLVRVDVLQLYAIVVLTIALYNYMYMYMY